MVPRLSVVRRPSQGSPVSFKRRPRKKAAPSSEPCRICSARKAARLLPTPTHHRAKPTEAANQLLFFVCIFCVDLHTEDLFGNSNDFGALAHGWGDLAYDARSEEHTS